MVSGYHHGMARADQLYSLAQAWNENGPEGFLDLLPPEFEFSPDPRFPDVGSGTYSGEALKRWMHDWAGAWETVQLEVLGVTEHGDAALGRCQWHVRGAASGVVAPPMEFTFVGWFDDEGRPVKAMAFFDHERAVAEAEAGSG
jgi:hypothetical protein